MTKTYKTALRYLNNQEKTDISYAKIGEENKKLIVSFASNGKITKDYFQRKLSLLELKYNENNFDILYLRNQNKWYLQGLNGIGENINHTISFLKKEFSKYDKVLCTGYSAGGYASLLFGSLCNAHSVVAIDSQTDLDYLTNFQSAWSHELRMKKKQCPTTWIKYNKIKNVLNSNVLYFVSNKRNKDAEHEQDKILHGDYHYDQIKNFPSVSDIRVSPIKEITNFIKKA